MFSWWGFGCIHRRQIEGVLLLQGVKLSDKEQRELDYKVQVYELAKKRQDQEDAIRNREEYRMPDSYDDSGQVKQDERMQLLTKRFE